MAKEKESKPEKKIEKEAKKPKELEPKEKFKEPSKPVKSSRGLAFAILGIIIITIIFIYLIQKGELF